MVLKIEITSAFKKHLKKAKKRNLDLAKLNQVVDMLQKQMELPKKYKDHLLKGNFKDLRECHIEPDWLLIYKIEENSLILFATGTHSDLFKM